MMKSPTASPPNTTGPRMRSSMTMSPCGMRKRRAAGEQLVGGGPVTAKPLALAVRCARPAHVWALVPVEAEPAQVGEDGVLVPVVRARGVRVVDAQHEVAARV